MDIGNLGGYSNQKNRNPPRGSIFFFLPHQRFLFSKKTSSNEFPWFCFSLAAYERWVRGIRYYYCPCCSFLFGFGPSFLFVYCAVFFFSLPQVVCLQKLIYFPRKGIWKWMRYDYYSFFPYLLCIPNSKIIPCT